MILNIQIFDDEHAPFEMAVAYNKNTQAGAVADLNGNIQLRASNNDEILIQAMGYKDIRFLAKNAPTAITMQPTNNDLDAVVLNYKKKTNKTAIVMASIATALAFIYTISDE